MLNQKQRNLFPITIKALKENKALLKAIQLLLKENNYYLKPPKGVWDFETQLGLVKLHDDQCFYFDPIDGLLTLEPLIALDTKISPIDGTYPSKRELKDLLDSHNLPLPIFRTLAIFQSNYQFLDPSTLKPFIYFNSSVFHKLTNNRFLDIPNQELPVKDQAVMNYVYSLAESRDISSANISTCFGLFQLRGKDFKLCGYDDVLAFANDQHIPIIQIHSALTFFDVKKLLPPLRKLDWYTFLKGFKPYSLESTLTLESRKLQRIFQKVSQDD